MQIFKTFLVYVQNRIVLKLVTFGFLKKSENSNLVRLGTSYGGWWIDEHQLNSRSGTKTLVSAGLGFDVSFDMQMFLHDFTIIGVDPLEDSVKYARETLGSYPQIHLICSGLWTTSGVGNFYAPQNMTHDSWSIQNIQKTDINLAKEFPVISIRDLLSRFPVISQSDFSYLKMDIEGAELDVLSDVVSNPYRFDMIAAEMDFLSLIGFKDLKSRISMVHRSRKLLCEIERNGYQLIYNEHFNFFWEFRK